MVEEREMEGKFCSSRLKKPSNDTRITARPFRHGYLEPPREDNWWELTLELKLRQHQIACWKILVPFLLCHKPGKAGCAVSSPIRYHVCDVPRQGYILDLYGYNYG